jgi:hypothetical protein
VDESPVKGVPRNALADDVAVAGIVDRACVIELCQEGNCASKISRAKRCAVFYRGREIKKYEKGDPQESKDIGPVSPLSPRSLDEPLYKQRANVTDHAHAIRCLRHRAHKARDEHRMKKEVARKILGVVQVSLGKP